MSAIEQAPPGYDHRHAASHYASILASIGGFVVAAIVLLFTVRDGPDPHSIELRTLGAGMLVLAFAGCLLGSFGMAAIAAERTTVPALAPALMYVGVTAVIAVIALFAAFEVLSTTYLPEAHGLFIVVVYCSAAMAVTFTSLGVADAYWLTSEGGGPNWIDTRRGSVRWSAIIGAGSVSIVAVGICVNLLVRPVHVHLAWTTSLVVGGLVIAFLGVLGSFLRFIVPGGLDNDADARGLQKSEVIGIHVVESLYFGLVVASLPWS